MKGLPLADFEVPERYHKDLLHVMPVNARSLYAYWEISDRRRWLVSQHFECDYGTMPKIVRVYDVTGIYFTGSNAHRFFDIWTTPEAASWYIHGLNADRTYLLDFGTYTWNREFIPLLRSNCAATPKDQEAPWGEAILGVVPEAESGAAGGRIPPRFFENFTPYTPYSR